MKNTQKVTLHKLLPILLYAILLSFISCDKKKENHFLIGVSQCSDDMWRQTMNDEMLLEVSRYSNVKLEIKTVKDDTPQQIKDIEYFIDKKVDLLIISPNESAAITPIVTKAYESDIPVVLIDRKIDTEHWTSYVGANNYQIGREVGVYVARVLKAKGNVVVMRGWNGATSDKERYAGFTEAIKNYPNIQIVGERWGNFLQDEAKRQMANLLKENIDIDLVFALNDPMALGVYEAAQSYSGRMPFIVGIDALPGAGGGIENIEKGLIDASFIYPTGGDEVVNLAMKILEQKDFKRENILYTAVVDKSNAHVIQLQVNQLLNRQRKISETNQLLTEKIAQYSDQQTLIYAVLVALALITLLFILIIFSYVKVRRSNKLLKKQKEQMEQMSIELEKLTNDKLVFFTNVSHEFKTPLTLILGPIDSMLETVETSSQQEQLLRIMKRNGMRLQNLLSQVIEFRRFQNNKMNASFEKQDIISFIKDLNSSFTEYAKSKKIYFVFEPNIEGVSTIDIDVDKVEKIYFNILSNAFKHTKAGGRIRVNLTEVFDQEEYVKISITNDGDLIPQDKISLIFDRFYKVNSSESGTGIGLALTNALVEMHRGKIFVRSTLEEGTVFEVLLPVKQNYQPVLLQEASFSEINYVEEQIKVELDTVPNKEKFLENNSEKELLLIIEDNIDMRSYLCYILHDKYNLIEAKDGEEGLELAVTYVPDLIICDVMMPNKDGFETCTFLKNNSLTSHIPVVILTACSLDEQKAIGYNCGADAYISKPFNAELLNARLQAILDNRQRVKEAFSNYLIDDTTKNSLLEKELLFLDEFQEYVTKNITDVQLNVVDIAQSMGLSRSQLYRKMKSLSGYSPNEYIRILRLKYAVKLLKTDNQITEIAYQAGFSSASYFTKCFKDFYNESPTDYLKKNGRV